MSIVKRKKIFKMRKDKRTSIQISKEDLDTYNQIREGGLSHPKVMEYLLQLHLTEPTKGIDKAERRVQQFLYLGTDGEKITVAMIRGVDKISKKKGIKALNANACKEIYEKYKEQIEAYNSKL